MVLKIKFVDHSVDFACLDENGAGLDDLMNFIGLKKSEITDYEILVQTKSYTALRQAYLLASLLGLFSGSTVKIDGEKVEPGKTALPTYEE